MASVFRRGQRWYARFKDADGHWVKEAGFTDKAATLQLAIKREHEAALVRKGLIEAPKSQTAISIDAALESFGKALANRGVSADQVTLVFGRCQRLVTGCSFGTVVDIDPIAVDDWLAKQRNGRKGKKGVSVQTSNHYLRAIKQFTRWLSRHKQLREDPLVHLEMLNVAVDRRHDRRALSDDEVSRLLMTTLTNGSVLGMPAKDRQMLYVMALSTGLRATELSSLKSESLALESNPPTVRVKAGYSKRRRLDVLPLPSESLDAARAWLKNKPKGESLWPGAWAKNRCAGKMLQVDLKASNIEYQDADGLFADFHSLRHTYITNLARHGVPLATAQKLARHSTPVLTAARYTHIELSDQHREVEKLPPLIGTNTGQTRDAACPKLAKDDKTLTDEEPVRKRKKPHKGEAFHDHSSGEAGILCFAD